MSGARTAATALAMLVAACAEPGTESDCGAVDLAPLETPPTYAVVSSDYTSSAVGLLDERGAVITPAWVDSGTATAGIVAALSGDVSLATVPAGPCSLVLLDRFGTDVISMFDPCGDAPVRWQVDVGSSFAANPRDLLRVGELTLVSRYSLNRAAPDGDLARGNDLAVIDRAGVSGRIDLGALGDVGEALARPDRIARVTSPAGLTRVVVGLARLSDDFMTTGPGAVAVVDAATRRASLHPLDGLVNCGEVDPAGAAVVVTCQGVPFADEATRRAGAGIVALALDESGQLVEIAGYRAVEHPDAPAPTGPTVPLTASRWVTVAFGDLLLGVNDRVLRIEDGGADTLFEAEAFTIGDGAYDGARDLLLLPDAAMGAVRRFDGSGQEAEPALVTGCHGLPPREVRRIEPVASTGP